MKKKITEFMNTVSMRMAGISEKREAGDHLLEVLGVVIVVIVLLILFKTQMGNLLKAVTGQIQNNMTNDTAGLWQKIS